MHHNAQESVLTWERRIRSLIWVIEFSSLYSCPACFSTRNGCSLSKESGPCTHVAHFLLWIAAKLSSKNCSILHSKLSIPWVSRKDWLYRPLLNIPHGMRENEVRISAAWLFMQCITSCGRRWKDTQSPWLLGKHSPCALRNSLSSIRPSSENQPSSWIWASSYLLSG